MWNTFLHLLHIFKGKHATKNKLNQKFCRPAMCKRKYSCTDNDSYWCRNPAKRVEEA